MLTHKNTHKHIHEHLNIESDLPTVHMLVKEHVVPITWVVLKWSMTLFHFFLCLYHLFHCLLGERKMMNPIDLEITLCLHVVGITSLVRDTVRGDMYS